MILLVLSAQALAPPPVIVTSPKILAGAMSFEDYPSAALRRGAEGITRSRITLDATGTATSCVPAVSSGHHDLDLLACKLALARMRFSPARDAAGHGVATTIVLPVRWALDKEPPLAAPPKR